MMLSTRSSTLETMLDAIRQRDEQPKDLPPPALPARPTSRARRLPTASRRSASARPNHDEASDPGRNVGIFGSERCFGIPELLRYEEERAQQAATANAKAVVPGEKLDCGGSNEHAVNECTGLEDDDRIQTMQAILRVQKNFRGLQARLHFKQLKAAATNLQSFVRGERERQKFAVSTRRWSSAIVIQKHVRRRSARAVFNGQLGDVILLQSAIRGRLARQRFIVSSAASKRRQENNEQSQIYHELAELRSQLLKTEAALQEKEEENAMLKQRLQEHDIRWSNYESKMKSMEATWQGQLNSLQMNFAAARKSYALEEIAKQNRRRETPISEAPSSSSEVQPLKDMLSKLQKNSNSVPMRNHETAAPSSVVRLTEEFDRQQEIFNNDAVLVNGAKSSQGGTNINHLQELRELKARFASWKKDYKMRLREGKTELVKLGSPEEKAGTRKHWWCAARIK